MQSDHKLIYNLIYHFIFFSFFSCTTDYTADIRQLDRLPSIDPDYCDVTIPPNIAPLNFLIKEHGDNFRVTVSVKNNKSGLSFKSSEGKVHFPEKKWRKITEEARGDTIKIYIAASYKGKTEKFQPVIMTVAKENIDPYLSYRLILPGYSHWSDLKIVQRNIESFKEKSIADNQILDNNCINCHSYNQNNPEQFLLHIRGSRGGTYFIEGENIARTELITKDMPGSATYPAWHPGGRYVAFSSNNVKQNFYSFREMDHEVFDLISSLILYDRDSNEIIKIEDSDTIMHMQTFPSWSPEGRYLYFCRAKQFKKNRVSVKNVRNIHYDLARKKFFPETRSFGPTEIVFEASAKNKSVSFPKISPDGKYLIFTLHDFGTFPVWHKEADLYLLNLQNNNFTCMNVNSSETESYHGWSSNGKWIVFSSKRRDGRSSNTYFSYIDSMYNSGKPFILPQKNSGFYNEMFHSFNVPELMTGEVKIGPRDFENATKKSRINANQQPEL